MQNECARRFQCGSQHTGPAVVLRNTQIWLLQNLACKSQVSATVAAPYSKLVLFDSCIEWSSLCISFVFSDWRSQCPQTNPTCHVLPCGCARTIKNHHFVLSKFCIPIEHNHTKMAQILFKSKTRHFWCLGLEFRGFFEQLPLRPFLYFWHAFAAMAASWSQPTSQVD